MSPQFQGRSTSQVRNQSEGKVLLAICFTLVFCTSYSSTLTMEVYFFETFVDFQQTAGDITPYIHGCENLKPCIHENLCSIVTRCCFTFYKIILTALEYIWEDLLP
jgi:hypothetical protein